MFNLISDLRDTGSECEFAGLEAVEVTVLQVRGVSKDEKKAIAGAMKVWFASLSQMARLNQDKMDPETTEP